MRCKACGKPLTDEEYCPQCGSLVVREHAVDATSRQLEPQARLRSRSAGRDEVTLWTGSFSWKGLFRELLVSSLLSAGLLYASFQDSAATKWTLPVIGAIWLALLLWLVYQKLNVAYQLTTQRLIHKRGILYRRVNRIEAIDIDDIGYEQGLIERIIDVGRIRVASSDVSHRRGLLLNGINHPREVYELIEQARREERLRYGLHVEAV